MKTIKLTILFLLLVNYTYAQQPQIGIITAISDKLVTLKLETNPTNVKPLSIGYESKDLTGTKGPLGMTFTSGWFEIGEIRVKSINKNSAIVEIVKEKTDIVINGKVQKQFVVGKKIKIEWTK